MNRKIHISILIAVGVVVVLGVLIIVVQQAATAPRGEPLTSRKQAEQRAATPASPRPGAGPATPAKPQLPGPPVIHRTLGDGAGGGMTIEGTGFHPARNVVLWDGEPIRVSETASGPARRSLEPEYRRSDGTLLLTVIPPDAPACNYGDVQVKTPWGESNVVKQKVFEDFLMEIAAPFSTTAARIGETITVASHFNAISPTAHDLAAVIMFNKKHAPDETGLIGYAPLAVTLPPLPKTSDEPTVASLTIPAQVETCSAFFPACAGRSGRMVSLVPGEYWVDVHYKVVDSCGDVHQSSSPIAEPFIFTVLP